MAPPCTHPMANFRICLCSMLQQAAQSLNEQLTCPVQLGPTSSQAVLT
jgi:hypothetical protein